MTSLQEAQRQNFEDLKLLYSENKISKNEIEELLNEATKDEEYEVAVSIRDFLKTIYNDNKL
jgi:protein-arginine kinase activator protein McsA